MLDILRSPWLPDAAARSLLRLAFAAARLWWFVRRPNQVGALVVLWRGGEALLVRQSYQPLWTAPGGGVGPGEQPVAAAARELAEEIGIRMEAAALRPALSVEHFYLFRHDRVHFFEAAMPEGQSVALDRREIVEARWMTPAEALALPLIPHLRSYFEERR